VRTSVRLEAVGAFLAGQYDNPFELLGPHVVEQDGRRALSIRAYLPDSQQVWLEHASHEICGQAAGQGRTRPMRRIHPAGLYEAICPLPENVSKDKIDRSYQLHISDDRGHMKTIHDPYAFPTLLTEFDLHLVGEGTHVEGYKRFGAQLRTIDGVTGVNFAVWAPNAQSVSIIGDFNGWDARRHSMRKLIPSGVWELFVPDIGAGETYKYRVKTAWGENVDKADPYGFAAELPPRTASIVADLDKFQWTDNDWMRRRAENNQLEQPISVYEVHLGSWQRGGDRAHGWLSYRDLAHKLVDYCKKMGYTHLELLPISEHPYSGSWGYQTVGYFSATSRYGSPEDFMYFVNHCHENGIGVIVDWVPAHFPRDQHGLRLFDGSPLYEHADPRQGEHPDWGTMIFNYGRNEVRSFLLSNAMFWFDKHHIDGLRVDAVASMLYLDYSRKEGEWIPNEYGGRENTAAISLLRTFNEKIHGTFPGALTIAEESTAWGGVSRPTNWGGLGFSLKWNMGWMNDTLRYMRRDSIYRRFHHNDLTFSLIYAFSENFCLPLSHDEVVHGKGSLISQMSGDLWQKFANLRLLYSYMWTHPGKKLLFMGGDIAQWKEWHFDESLDWSLLEWETHKGIQKLVADLNAVYKREPALHQVEFDSAGFEWIDCLSADDSVLAYIRRAKDPKDYVLVCANFTPVVRDHHVVGAPEAGFYREIFNSDSSYYGGSNVGNIAGVEASDKGHHGRPFSLTIRMPPLGVVVFKPETRAP
jgi:1,4-alpha-glucan branching enzyme